MRIPLSEIRLLWHADFWDGPLSGMLRYAGEECWFEVLESETALARRYAVLRLSPSQRADEERWHDLFRRHVGHNCSYDENNKRIPGLVHPREEWHHFYGAQAKRIKPEYVGNEVLGWFEM